MEEKAGRRARAVRLFGGAALLLLLGASALAGAQPGKTREASVPVRRESLAAAGESGAQMSAAERLARDRQEELELLEGVLSDTSADARTRQDALEQKRALAERMEREAEARACLTAMGYEKAQVVCGAGIVTVLLPAEAAGEAGAAIVSAVAEQTGAGSENVKLILTK